jgi:hypothetical protein
MRMAEKSNDRALLLRTVCGYDYRGGSKAFCKFLGIKESRWAMQMQRGLSLDVATKFVEKLPGMTLDWLILGRADTLSLEWRKKLGLMGHKPSKPDHGQIDRLLQDPKFRGTLARVIADEMKKGKG